MIKLFFGWIHPKYKKEMSTRVTSLQTVTPVQVVIPMQQHIGTPCTPLVQVGDTVKRPQRLVLAVEDNKTEAIEKLRSFSEEFPEVEICVLPTRYPQGAEKQLLRSVTGREVLPGKLPLVEWFRKGKKMLKEAGKK